MKQKNIEKISEAKTLSFPMKILQPIAGFLNQELVRLERKRKDIAKEDPFKDARRVNDNASPDTDVVEQIGHERAKALETQINRKVIQIKKALSMIKIGKYGTCESCGKMIDTERLMIMPEVTICIDCEKKREK